MILDGQFRTRLEAPFGVNFVEGAQDSYLLTRARLGLGFRPTSWLKLYGEAQDIRAFSYVNSPSSLRDPIDFRQAYVELRANEGKAFSLRAGRQELNYGGGRLISAADWAMAGRSFDGVVAAGQYRGMKIDTFHASVVEPNGREIDRHRAGEGISGVYVSAGSWIPGATLEPYLFYRTRRGVLGKDAVPGSSEQWVSGFRWAGKAPHGFDYSGIVVVQRGSHAHDSISALGVNYTAGWTAGSVRWTPRVSGEYNSGSGDRGKGENVQRTFDQLYGSFHYLLGAADRFGWRNSRQVRAGVDFVPRKNWKAFVDLRDVRLASVKDALYNCSGVRYVSNPNATSRHVGLEVDAHFAWKITPKTTFGAGMGYLFAGEYLKQSTSGANYLLPYIMVTRIL